MSDPGSLIRSTKQELENARTKGQMIGWLQGAGTVIAVGVALKFLGWIPFLAVVGVVGYVGWRLLRGRKS